MEGVIQILVGCGVAAMLVAIVGGGAKAFGLHVPHLLSLKRQATLFVLGLALVAAAWTIGTYPRKNGGPAPDEVTNDIEGPFENFQRQPTQQAQAPSTAPESNISAAPDPARGEPMQQGEPPPTQRAEQPEAQPRIPPQGPRYNSAGCLAPQLSLSFLVPGNTSGAFQNLTGSQVVTMYDCDSSGQFSTSTNVSAGPLDNMRGHWDRSRIVFEFGYRTASGAYGDVVCSVAASAAEERHFRGRISCQELEGVHAMSASDVEVSY
jgi:hypothetical protein